MSAEVGEATKVHELNTPFDTNRHEEIYATADQIVDLNNPLRLIDAAPLLRPS